MSNRFVNIIAACLLAFMFFMAVSSMRDDVFTFDETAHIGAGYSYLSQKDMRMNPEHPPLIKDLAAAPLLFLGLNFPAEHPSWVQSNPLKWWFQFDFASQFLYQAGNDPEQILFWSRLPMIFVLMIFGFFVFWWSKELFGAQAALLPLFLFCFSPTLLAHGRLITTDVGAAASIFIATYCFIKALIKPNKKNIVLAGIAFGVAQLCKFSAILLGPFFIFLILCWWICQKEINFKTLKKLSVNLLLIFIIGFLLIGAVYNLTITNYPVEKQTQDIKSLISPDSFKLVGSVLTEMAHYPVLRAYAQYFLGLTLVFERSAGGNTTYFLGEISANGWKNYFPVVYAIKIPLAFHILTLTAILYIAWLIKKPFWENGLIRARDWMKNNFAYFAMLSFLVLYWTISLKTNLNIGVRHLMPIFAFNIVLVSAMIVKWLRGSSLPKIKYAYLAILLAWQAFSVLSIYPHFLAYFNELVGGPDKGYLYTVDSNLDWGQDLKRLKQWTDKKGIDKIYLDYFGGGNPSYFLKEKYIGWWGTRDQAELPKGSYLAISSSLLQGGRGIPSSTFDQPCGYYRWLDQYEPIEKIGYSIFIYHIE